MTGHLIGAAGALETLAVCLQIKNDFIHASVNSNDIHPEVMKFINPECIPATLKENTCVDVAVKAGFGFGDVNACVVLKKID